MCEDRLVIIMYGSIMSLKKQNNIYNVVTNGLYTHSSVILVLLRNSDNKHQNSSPLQHMYIYYPSNIPVEYLICVQKLIAV